MLVIVTTYPVPPTSPQTRQPTLKVMLISS